MSLEPVWIIVDVGCKKCDPGDTTVTYGAFKDYSAAKAAFYKLRQTFIAESKYTSAVSGEEDNGNGVLAFAFFPNSSSNCRNTVKLLKTFLCTTNFEPFEHRRIQIQIQIL